MFEFAYDIRSIREAQIIQRKCAAAATTKPYVEMSNNCFAWGEFGANSSSLPA